MSRKSRLIGWCEQLGADIPETATVAELEAAIDAALATKSEPELLSFRDGLIANWRVIKSELPATVCSVFNNLRGAE